MRDDKRELLRKVVLSWIVGGLAIGTDIVVFLVLYQYWNMNEYLANAISIEAGTILSFVLNVLFIFKVKDKLFRRFLLFNATAVVGIVVSDLILRLGNYLHLPVVPVKYFSIIFVAAAQFFVNYFLAFGDKNKEEIEVVEEIEENKD
jgi:putative flippase GtrA